MTPGYDARMHILVIGGTAFMGPEIVRRLIARGHDVSILHRRDRHNLGPDVRNVQADRGDLPAVSALLARERFEAVFDLAYDWQKGTPAQHVEAAARSCGDRLHRYVFMSSIAVYPPGLDRRESDALAPEDTPNPYVQHKVGAEHLLFRMHADFWFSGDDIPAAIRSRAAPALLSRAVLLGSAARSSSDHPARRRRWRDAVGVRLGRGRRLRAGA